MDERTMADKESQDVLAQRLLRLEERMDRFESAPAAPLAHPAWPLALGGTAMTFGYLGMGMPKHLYQFLFAGLLLLLAYHRGFLRLAGQGWQWPLAAVNYLNFLLFFLIVLGGGMRYPFHWFKVPAVVKNAPPAGGAWYDRLMPDYGLQWYAIPGLSDWAVDLTKIQVFLLIATLAGVLFRFQGLSSITALALLLVSVPVYLSFTWDWVVLFLIAGSVSLYLQSSSASATRRMYGS